MNREILIVDDHLVVRTGVSIILEENLRTLGYRQLKIILKQ
jgi:DNA-binding NarL/FixJ family response regulator